MSTDGQVTPPDRALLDEARRLALIHIQEGFGLALAGAPMPRQLYHYTTMSAFLSIMKSSSIWATDCRYLNDTKELSYGVSFVASRLEESIKRYDDADVVSLLEIVRNSFSPLSYELKVYCASFSAEDDDINQWRGYGSGTGGICLQMDVRPPTCHDNGTRLLQVIYETNEQSQLVDGAIDRIVDLYRSMPEDLDHLYAKSECCMAFREVCLPLVLRFKSPHWRSEKEWRLIIVTDHMSPAMPLKHRIGQMGIIPYLEIPIRREFGADNQKLPVDKIIIGPHYYSDAIKQSVIEFIRHSDITPRYGIHVSTIPLR